MVKVKLFRVSDDHVALGIGEDGIRMSSDVVEKVASASHGVLSWSGLSGSKGAECDKDGHVDGSTII